MQVFSHCLYEFQKGVRDLILLTLEIKDLDNLIKKLEKQNIPYHIQAIKNNKANLYFGQNSCIEVIKSFKDKELNKLSPEEDFILGILLGYERCKQCERYLNKKN